MNDCAFSQLWRQIETEASNGVVPIESVAQALMRFDGRKVRINGQIISRSLIKAAARRMVDAGVPRAVASRRLMHNYSLSRRQAYRYINEALNGYRTGY